MKKFIIFTLVIIFCFSFSGCLNLNLTANYCVPLSDAPEEVRSGVEEVSAQAVRAIENGDMNAVLEIASPAFKKQSTEELSEVLSVISERIPGKFKLEDAYYITFAAVKDTPDVFTVGELSSPDYYFSAIPFSKETAAVFFTSQQGALTYILAANFGYTNGKWEINSFMAGNYAVNGMKAPEIYEKALSLRDRGDLASAALYAQILNEYLSPANTITYPDPQDMVKFINEITERANSEFVLPMSIDTEEGSFEVARIQGGAFEEGLCCIISYVSPTAAYESNDSVFRREGRAVADSVESYFPGLKDNFDIFVLKAFEELPADENKLYTVYTTIIEN